ncbi:MAG: hypothetical protein H0V81_11365 [Solirubrobacterales bacterium]|nr:hypothetical protein [Solirubrobacterales bacterium]
MKSPRRALIIALAALALAPSGAHAATASCSESGDVCYSARKMGGVVRLQFGTFSFSGRVEICVSAPRRSKADCKTFRLRKPDRMGIHALDVAWSKHFPRRGKGTYRVSFRPTFVEEPFSPRVSFKLRG